MNNSNENRGQKSAGNKKSNQNPHLSDKQLLLSLDGELSAHETTQVEIHLEACWSCRARREQIEKAIADVVEYRDHLVQPHFPISTDGRSKFIAGLEGLARSIRRPPLWKQILRGLRVWGSTSPSEVPRYVWIGGLVVGALVLFSFGRLWQTPKVSASELLENAQGSEVRALQSVPKPVVYEKLSIRVGSQTVTRTIYRDPIGHRQADQLNLPQGMAANVPSNMAKLSQPNDQPSGRQADAELRRTLLTAHLSWEDPLSPANFSAWYKSLDEKLDEVTTVGEDFITLKTTTSEGPIAEASITVRATDFHPVAEDLRLQDAREVEVHELAWEVLPMEAINAAIFESEPAMLVVNRHPATMTLLPPAVTEFELAEAELRARVAIHAEKADLGEQIELDRDTSRSGQSVVVHGIVSSPDRKNDLLAALQGIPHVEVRLKTLAEAQAQSEQEQVPTDDRQDAAPQIAQEAPSQEHGVVSDGTQATKHEPVAIVISGRPAFERQLEERFPIGEDRTAFVNETVEFVQDAMAQAWALRRLTNRYTPEMVAELSSGSQQTLELLIRDHVSALRQDVDEVRARVSPFLSPTALAAAPPPISDPSLFPAAMPGDWRGTVMSVFSETQKVNNNGGALLAESDQTLSDPQAVVSELQLALGKLETQLSALYQQVSGPFLSESKNIGK